MTGITDSHIGISLGDDDDDGAADGAGGKKKKDVTSNYFLEEYLGRGVGTGARIDDNDVVVMDT